MAEVPQNSINQVWVNNADGFSIKGGTTERTVTVSGGNVTIDAAGSAEVTFPDYTSTLATMNNFYTSLIALGGLI